MKAKTRVAKKQTARKAKQKAAENGVSTAQKAFLKILNKADPGGKI